MLCSACYSGGLADQGASSLASTAGETDPDDGTRGADTSGPSPESEGGADTGGMPEMPTDGFLGGFFPIGVFSQPAYTMADWQGIGLNTMLEIPQGEDAGEWDDEARRLGMAMIRPPIGDPASDIGRTDLLAWMLPDEPDVEANNGPCGGNCVSLIQSMSSSWRAIDPDRAIFVNVAGPNVLLSSSCDYCNGPGDDPPQDGCYPDNDECYPAIFATADWISEDIYPVTGWLPSEQMRADITVVGRALDRMRAWTDKPRFAIIELSDQRLGFDGTGNRAPTAAEYRAEIWHAIIHGAHGIFYFPHAFNPFEWEAVPPDVLDEMLVQHELIDELAPLLQSDADPDAMSIAVDAPLEATWRQTEDTAWVFVLNTANAPGVAKITIDGVDADAEVYAESRSLPFADGGITDEFTPYAVHVYALPR
ncbi:MAG TPA: hypothetical protein VFG69_21645 [Nannocystaceae bacterium]|nr:hypothetical protein [Nannocystaceae bacterium]